MGVWPVTADNDDAPLSGLAYICECGSHSFYVMLDEDSGWHHVVCQGCEADVSELMTK